MNGPVTIRRLGADDVALFRALRLAALAGAPDAFGSVHAIEAARPDAAFAARLAGSAVFAAFAGRDAVGMVGLSRNDGPRERHKGFLWGMHVDPASRGRGVGGALIAAAIAAAPAALRQIHLTVVRDNASAIALYRRHGFRGYGVEPRALATADGFADEVLMVRLLDGDGQAGDDQMGGDQAGGDQAGGDQAGGR